MEIRRTLLGKLGGIGEREGPRERLAEKIEGIDHRHVGDEIDGDGEFARLLRKHEPCKPVSVRVLLPVHEMLRRRHLERVAFDARAAMRGRAQPDDLRGESNRPVVAIAREMIETGEDRHTLLGYRKTASISRNFSMQFSRLPDSRRKRAPAGISIKLSTAASPPPV